MAKTKNRTVETSMATRSINSPFVNLMGSMAEDIPRIKSILKMLLPIMFPMAMEFSFFLMATMEATSSGSDVPKATMVRPITV